MAENFVQLNTDGTGKKIDTFTEATFGQNRQAIVIAYPSVTNGVAPVSGTNCLSVTLTTPIPAGSNNIGTVTLSGTAPISGTVTANQGTPNTLSNAWPVELSDGTNLLGTSSHPVRIDPTGTTTQPVSLTSTTITGSVAVTGTFFQATQPVSGTLTVTQATGTNLHTVLDSGTLTSITNALPAGTNVIGHVIADTGSTTAVTGNVTVVQPTGTNLHVVNDASSAVIGHVITDTGSTTAVTGNVTVVQPTGSNLNVAVSNFPATQPVSGTVTANAGTGTFTTSGTITTATTGGFSTKSGSGLTNTAVSVKASAGQVYGWFLDNTENAAATTFFQFFNATSATVGTTTPLFSLAIPGGSSANVFNTQGIAFATGIMIAATTGYSNGTAPTSSVTYNVFYA